MSDRCAHAHPVRRLNGEVMPCPACGSTEGADHPVLDLSRPMGLRAHMARRGLMFDQLAPYDDPERGWVDPLDDDDVRIEVRRFVGQLWKAALRAERDSSPPRDDDRERPKSVVSGRTETPSE